MGGVRSLVTAAVLASSNVASAGLLGAETSVATTGKMPSVASNGTTFLVVWSDGADVYGERFDNSGTALAAAFAITNAAGAQTQPQVASNGTDYFVVWSDARTDAGDIYGASVSAAGTVGSAVAITTAAATQDAPHLASDGTNYLVAWESTSGDHYDIYASLVSSGVPGSAFAVRATQWEEAPAVGSLGGNYLVAWSEYRDHVQGDVYGQLLTGAAAMTGSSFLIDGSNNHQGFPAIASNGTSYVVAWEDTRTNNDFDIYAARVASDSTVSDTTGMVITTYTGEQRFPAIASNGTDYILAWEDDRATQDVYGTLLAGTTVSTANGFAVASSQAVEEFPAIAYNSAGLDYMIAYQSGAGIYVRIARQCGDGVLQSGELCDDGNASDGDGCSATCGVESGFTCSGSPSLCADIDECLTDNGGCQQVCTNTIGSYACDCTSGYSLQQDGISCSDIDECATGNGGCGQTCTNSIGSYTCSCLYRLHARCRRARVRRQQRVPRRERWLRAGLRQYARLVHVRVRQRLHARRLGMRRHRRVRDRERRLQRNVHELARLVRMLV